MFAQRFCILRRFSNMPTLLLDQASEVRNQINMKDSSELLRTDLNVDRVTHKSVLEECTEEDVSHVATYLKPTFNFAAYVNKSETLQELVKLNVDLNFLEKRVKDNVVPYILSLNFEKDIKNHLIFLSDVGVDNIGWFLTKNPFIFQQDLANLTVRINYLKSKNFTDEMITSIISRNPNWLMFSTQVIDEKLGYFQKEFGLMGREVRALAVKLPKLITYSLKHVKLNIFVFKEEMGLTGDELKSILLKKPYLFIKLQTGLLKTFQFVHKDMKIPIERIVEAPEVLTCRLFRLKQRHLFLQHVGRVQYNPRQPNYVPLVKLVSGTDAEFCADIAKSSTQDFNSFLKSL